MTRLLFLLCLCLVFLPGVVGATIVWENDFDGYSDDWICCLSDCSAVPGNPPGFIGFKSNANYLSDCSSRIVNEADRSGGVGENRGFRIRLFQDDNVTQRDSMMTVSIPAGNNHLFFRWYMRESKKSLLGQYDKILRIFTTGGTQIITQFRETSGTSEGSNWNIWNSNTGNHYISGWDADVEVQDDVWYCYEVEIDLGNDLARFYFDGVLISTLTSQGYPDVNFSYFTIGGNAEEHHWTDPQIETRDHDDFIVADAYVGTDTAVSDATVCSSGCDYTTIQAAFDGENFAPGNEIVISAGTYREMVTWGDDDSGDSGDQVTLRAATGETVKILASDIETGWAGPDGNGEYTVAETTTVNILYADGVRLDEGTVTSLAADEWDWDTNVLYLGFDPAGIVIEAGQRSKCIDVNDQSYVTIQDITVGHANTTWEGAINAYTGGDGIIIDNVIIDGSYKHGVFISSSDNSRISDCTITNFEGYGIRGATLGATENTGLAIYGNTITGSGVSGGWGDIGIGVDDYNDMDIYDNTIADLGGHGIAYAPLTEAGHTMDDIEVYGNHITNVGIDALGMGVVSCAGVGSACTNVVIHDNYVKGVNQPTGSDGYCYDLDHGSVGTLCYRNWCEDAEGAGIGIIGVESTGNEVYHNVIVDIGLTAGKVSRAGFVLSDSTNNEFYNNTVYNAEIGIRAVSTATGNIWKNNIFSGCVTQDVYFDATSSGTLDYNVYYPDGASRFYFGGAASDDFADWQTDSGQDANSAAVDPLFVSVSADDFRLTAGSPAKNTGVDVSLTTDYVGTVIPVGAGPDIGAYEYTVGGTKKGCTITGGVH